MARPEKVAVVDAVRDAIGESAATLLTDYRGLSVAEFAELRAELRKTGATYRVVKNTLARRAATDAGIVGLEDILVGPTALVFCADDPVGPAKALKAFAKSHTALIVKGGYLDGEVLDGEAALKLADLESREDVLAGIAGLANSALATVINLAMAAQNEAARLFAALEADGGAEAKGFSPTAPASAPAEEAPAPEAPAEEAPGDEAPAEDAPAAEAPAEDAPAAEAPAEDATTDEPAAADES